MTAPRTVKQSDSPPCLHAVQPPVYCLRDPLLGNGLDGIVILSSTGEWITGNPLGKEIYDLIVNAWPHSDPVPEKVWAVCQIVLESHPTTEQKPGIAESEIQLPNSRDRIRIRARWWNFGEPATPHILMILENQTSSQQNLATTEAIRYRLSPRELEVWKLHRMGYRYQDIAAELHIALNTVKKHMKSTYAKQQLAASVEKHYANELVS